MQSTSINNGSDIAIIVVNYNSPEATDRIVEFLYPRITISHNLFVIDNGSDRNPPSKYTTTKLDINRNKLGGVLAGLHLASKVNPSNYWIISTSMKFEPFDGDPAKELIGELVSVRNSVGVIPGFVGNPIHRTHQSVMAVPGSKFHEARILGPYSLYRAEWLDRIGWFDPSLTSSWGVDYETSYIAHKSGKVLLVSDTVKVSIDESGKYSEDLTKYQQECRDEMRTVLSRKYGPDWENILGVFG